MVVIQPRTIIVSFSEPNRKLRGSFIDQNLPNLPMAWVSRIVFENIGIHGPGNYASNEIETMCHEIVEHWYVQIETDDESSMTELTDLANKIMLRVTQYQMEVESILLHWGLFNYNRFDYTLKEFVNEDDATFVHISGRV